MGHRFFHPDQLLELHGHGWVMLENDVTLGAVVPHGNGYFLAYVKKETRPNRYELARRAARALPSSCGTRPMLCAGGP